MSEPDSSPTAASESDAGDEDWVVPTEARESLSLFSPAATGFALFAVAALTGGGEPALVTRARHREALADCVAGLTLAREAPAPELAAEGLRRAAEALGRLTGRVTVEAVLDRIFGDFCLGK